MARIAIWLGTPYREVLVIDGAVGLGCSNYRDDVLAVQYLLRVASEWGTDSDPFQPPVQPPAKPLPAG